MTFLTVLNIIVLSLCSTAVNAQSLMSTSTSDAPFPFTTYNNVRIDRNPYVETCVVLFSGIWTLFVLQFYLRDMREECKKLDHKTELKMMQQTNTEADPNPKDTEMVALEV